MELRNCRLLKLGIIFFENNTEKSLVKIPKPELYTNIPMLWKILDSINLDWYRITRPYQRNIQASQSDSEIFTEIAKAFYVLPSYYLKCLFSYVMFFVSLDKAYDLFYSELNLINNKSALNLKHDKPPHRNEFIKKVNLIRNISIAHLGSTEVPSLDSQAAMTWLPLVLKKSKDSNWNIDEFIFGSGGLQTRDSFGNTTSQSIDLEIKSISEMHEKCIHYIDEYDEVCSSYLLCLAEKMPIKNGESHFIYNAPKNNE